MAQGSRDCGSSIDSNSIDNLNEWPLKQDETPGTLVQEATERAQDAAAAPEVSFPSTRGISPDNVRDSVAGLAARLQELAANKHILAADKGSFMQKLASKVASQGESSETLAAAPVEVDTAPSSPASFLLSDPFGADHVDYRSGSSSSLTAPDRLENMTPLSFGPPRLDRSRSRSRDGAKSNPPLRNKRTIILPPEESSDHPLRSKRTILLLTDELLDLEQLESALNEAIKIREGAVTIVENLEKELFNRMSTAEMVLAKKGVTGPTRQIARDVEKAEAKDAHASQYAQQAQPADPGSITSIPAYILPLPSRLKAQRQSSSKASEEMEQRGLAEHVAKDEVWRQVCEDKKLGEARWEEARKSGKAPLFLAAGRVV